MPVQLNHTIVAARDKQTSASFLADLLGLDPPTTYGPFAVIELANDVSLDFIDDQQVHPRHYAFLVTEEEFDEIFGRIQERGLDYYADPGGKQKGEINHHDGGRGVYWADPDGHWLEIITRPYGSGGSGG
jgi:catechol 2,3-dioxygenase-like lactoylglutathione lyase family enzyme